MVVTQQDKAEQISKIISPILKRVLAEYDFGKYPADPYNGFQLSFSSLNPTDSDIAGALVWKWGYWGKPNFPQHQKDLIEEIQNCWQDYCLAVQQNQAANKSVNTFRWWKDRLKRNTRYITVAYITHLIHHKEPLPIIDQHNFRAMNHLIQSIRPEYVFKKKPSNWQDIQDLKRFMQAVCAVVPGLSFSELDKFLMMFGRNHVQR